MDPRDTPCVQPEWRGLVERLGEGVILVLGPTDAGKTTLCRWLREALGEGTAWVDADVGQSTLGPPATVGLELDGRVVLRFVGVTSPVWRPARFLSAVQEMVRLALRRGARRVIVDTTGLVRGEVAWELKRAKVEMLRPRHLVVLGPGMEPLGRLAELQLGACVHRLPLAPARRVRTLEERRAYREARLREHLAGARPHRVPRHLPLDPPGELSEGTLLGLAGAEGTLLSLGVIWEGQLLSPLADLSGVRLLQRGRLRVDPQGRQLAARSSSLREATSSAREYTSSTTVP